MVPMMAGVTVPSSGEQSGEGWYGGGSQFNWLVASGGVLLENTPGSFRTSTANQGFSPKYYGNAWTGNQYARTFSIGKIGGAVGKASFGLGTAMDIRGMLIFKDNPNSPNAVHPAKAALNAGIGYMGLKINPMAGALYFGVDAFYPGGWTGYGNDYERLQRANEAIIPGFITAPFGALKQ
jgi:hypothetical protein